MKTIRYSLPTLVVASFMAAASAQEVSVPDPGLNAAMRAALQKPAGPLTQQDLLSLTNLNACCRDVSSLEGLDALHNLLTLDLENNLLTRFNYPSNLTKLTYLNLSSNPLTNLFFPGGLTNLVSLVSQAGELTKFALPAGLTNLTFLQLGGNQLTNLTLPSDLRSLSVLGLENNQLAQLTLPGGLTNLSVLLLPQNQLTNVTLPPDLTRLTSLLLGDNPLASLVLSEPLASTVLASLVASLSAGGISVFTYPVTARLSAPRRTPTGVFEFMLLGPPGVYTVLSSVNLGVWNEAGTTTNVLGSAVFTDSAAPLSPMKFYRGRLP